MDQQQSLRLSDDLRGFFRGEMYFDALTRGLYSTDASIFQVQPAGVVQPRDEDDLCKLVAYAHENEVPLIARGAGTGLAGEALGAGLIVDVSKHFRRILEITDDAVRVQPGVVWASLQRELARIGRRFAPDTGSGAVCTLGGMLATDASGAHALKHGYTRDHVQSLRVVLDNGEAHSVGRERVPELDDAGHAHLSDILMALAAVLEPWRGTPGVAQIRMRFDRCGYRLDCMGDDGRIDLPRLLVGSEGTLALFTEATLRTIPLPGGRAVMLLGFASVDDALRGAMLALPYGPSACDLIDRRLLSMARGASAASASGIVPAQAEAVLLIEFETDYPSEALRLAEALTAQLTQARRLAVHAVTAAEPADQDRLWQLRQAALPSLFMLKGGAQALPFVEDVGVPLEVMPDFLRRVQEILHEHETTASFLIHAGAGQIHTRPFLDLDKPQDAAKVRPLAEKIHALAIELGGTISTQHGVGLARTPWVARQAGPLYRVYRQIKSIFDPRNLFNPGKIVDPDPDLATWPLRGAGRQIYEPISLNLRWEPAPQIESNHCNGCGHCRTEALDSRMCPVFRATQHEAATPRAKANLFRQLMGDGAKGLANDRARAIADLCINCKMCVRECPASVDVPKLMLETKAANVAEHGLVGSDAFLAHLESWLRFGSTFSVLANAALRRRTVRWLLERITGLSARRRLPHLAAKPFLSLARSQGLTHRPSDLRRAVVYFVDSYANYVDPLVAQATVAVLQHQGFEVHVPPGQRGSGFAALSAGDAEWARENAQHNVRVLADFARAGVPIVCSEPSAVTMLRLDYPALLGDADSALIAAQAMEVSEFLTRLHGEGKLRLNLQGIDAGIGHHVPCHVKAHGPAGAPALLALIPRLRLHTIDVGCSGMGGVFGLAARNHDLSLAIGADMLREVDRPRVLFGSSECSSCRLQMEDAGNKRSLHPMQFLALAYGLLPEVERRLREPRREPLSR